MSWLRIWVDALMLDQEATGIGQYIYQLFHTYTNQFDEDRVVGLFQPGVSIPGVEPEYLNRSLSSAGRLFYEQWGLVDRLQSTSYDVLHFPDYQIPILRPQRRVVMTVHDLAAFVIPEVFPGSKTRTKRLLMRQSVKRASRIIVPSVATKNDLMAILGVPSTKIRVIPHGVKRVGKPWAKRVHAAPYFLSVGTIEPRKNFTRLIHAYHLLLQRRQDVPDLVIAGRLGWMYEETLELPEKLGVAHQVKFLQYVSEDLLATLYRDAVALVYPSLYEGFGLPVIEAMQAGLPVVTSAQGALKELGGHSLWRSDPYNVEAIADAMAIVLDGGASVRQKAQEAYDWAQQLTWEKASEATRAVYEEVILGG